MQDNRMNEDRAKLIRARTCLATSPAMCLNSHWLGNDVTACVSRVASSDVALSERARMAGSSGMTERKHIQEQPIIMTAMYKR